MYPYKLIVIFPLNKIKHYSVLRQQRCPNVYREVLRKYSNKNKINRKRKEMSWCFVYKKKLNSGSLSDYKMKRIITESDYIL